MELSRQMLLLTAENYGSYYLHITKIGVEVGIETHFVGSIVTKSIPKGQVWAGVPAHFLSAQ